MPVTMAVVASTFFDGKFWYIKVILIVPVFMNKTHQSYLSEEEYGVRQKPHTAGVYHHFPYGHFRGADSKLSAKAGVILTVQ